MQDEGQNDKHDDDHQGHAVTVIVNGREKTVTEKELTFDEVIALAFDPVPTGENVLITVTFRDGRGDKPKGTLVKGESVKIKDGMIFNVRATDKS